MEFSEVNIIINAACFSGLALVAFFARRRDTAQWSFAIGMILLAAEAVCAFASLRGASLADAVYWQRLRWSLTGLAFFPWLIFSVCYSRGSAAEYLKRRRVSILILGAVSSVLAFAFFGSLVIDGARANGPYILHVWLGWPGFALNLLNLFASVLVLMNLEATFRASIGTMRWRIKYLVVGMTFLFGARVYEGTQVLLSSGIVHIPESIGGMAQTAGCALIGFSLLRSRLSNVDVYPSHAVLHRSLTVIITGSYLMTVGLLAKLVGDVTGEEAPLVALVLLGGLVGLFMFLLSDRIRNGLRRLVSRHFRRPLHDYRKVWTAFNQRMTSVMNANEFCRDISRLVAETVEVLSVTIWLIDEERREVVFAASTAVSDAAGESLEKSCDNFDALVRSLREESLPIELGRSGADRLEPLRQLSPEYFLKGGHRICIPLRSGGQLEGVMALGDRVAGEPFSEEELELLSCIGDQVAASLRNIRLAHRLVESKEMEAFQTMSAFFVHDLKNTASSLSLILQNLPKHFDDPAFRSDALNAISRSTERISNLTESLSVIRQDLRPDFQPIDLNQVVDAALSNVPITPGVQIVRNLVPLPRARLDSDLIHKVVVNLVLNAREAVGDDGEIRIQTVEQDGMVVFSVIDDGCGISPEFRRKSLFRPFQTTKKKGIGIGLFHCRRIVEAHGGRIEVQSEPGKGATFRVLLPTAGGQA